MVRLSEKSDPSNIYTEYSYKVTKPTVLCSVKKHKHAKNPPFKRVFRQSVVRPRGFEPPACGLGNRRSILLSYGRMYQRFCYPARLFRQAQITHLPLYYKQYRNHCQIDFSGHIIITRLRQLLLPIPAFRDL